MKKEFVPYELTVKLKDLGFDEPCIYYFNKSENNQLWQDIESGYYRNSVVSKGNLLWGETYDNGNVSAPLWQQVFDWFNEKFFLMSSIQLKSKNHLGANYFYVIKNHKDVIDDSHTIIVEGFESVLKARQACLEKLIEIVDNENI